MINHMILHIMDFQANLCLLADSEMSLQNENIITFVEKHIKKLQRNSRSKKGFFNQNSKFLGSFNQYCSNQISIVDFSKSFSDIIYENIFNSDKNDPLDFLIVDYSDNDKDYLALLLMEYKQAFTHQVDNENGAVNNSIISHCAILPNVSQKIDSYAIIDKNTKAVLFSDKLRYIDDQDVLVLPDKVLECSTEISSDEAIKAVGAIAVKVAETYGENSAVVLSQAKNFIAENAEVSDKLLTEDLGKEIFYESEEQQKVYDQLLEEANVPKVVDVPKPLAVKTGRSHKIKTDTGIEISFPVEYFSNHDYIEFINNPDGTISIQLKNIGKITNK